MNDRVQDDLHQRAVGPLFTNIRQLLDAISARSGQASCMSFVWDSKRTEVQSNTAFLDSVQRFMAALLGHLPLRGSAVGLLLENHPLLPSLIVGAAALGLRIVPMNPAGHPSELAHIVASTGIRVVVVDQRTALLATECGLFEQILEIVRTHDHTLPLDYRSNSEDDASIVMHTSGTTAKPKGVVIGIDQVLQNAGSLAEWCGLHRSVQLTTLPMYHVHALTFGLFSSLVTDSHLVVMKSFDPLLWCDVVRDQKVTWTSIVPSLLGMLAVAGLTRKKCPSLKGIIVSSAPINEALAARVEERTGIPLLQAWGQTEFTCWATCCRAGLYGGEYDATLRSVGSALPGVTVDVITEAGDVADEGQVGELYLRGAYTAKGYLNEPELTRQTFTALGVRTGDLGYFRVIEGTKHFFIVGREKEVINRSGEKISPAAIEREIFDRFEGTAGRIAVVGFAHEVLGEEIGLCIDAAVFSEGVDEQTLLEYLRGMHLAFRPRVVHISSQAIVRTFTGKVQRARMRDRFAEAKRHLGQSKIVDERSREH
jgi:acyl-CoA synthetase (AMP-forming)/AMP-acid ligase II